MLPSMYMYVCSNIRLPSFPRSLQKSKLAASWRDIIIIYQTKVAEIVGHKVLSSGLSLALLTEVLVARFRNELDWLSSIDRL